MQQPYLRDRLRDTHKSLWDYLLRSINAQVATTNKALGDAHEIDPTADFSLRTNRVRIADHLKCSPNCIGDRLRRLKQAKLIEIVNHGPVQDFEVIFTYHQILKWVSVEEKYRNRTTFQNSQPASVSKGESESFVPSPYILQEQNNNTIIPVKKVSKLLINCFSNDNNFDIHAIPQADIAQEPIFNKNTEQNANFCAEYQKNIAKTENKLRAQAFAFAVWFVALAFDKLKLWENRRDKSKMYEPDTQREQTIDYIAENYFGKAGNIAEMQRMQIEYEYRLNAVARYRKKNNFDIQFPMQYFSLENRTRAGFIKTVVWYKTYLKEQAVKNKNKKIRTAESKLAEAVARINTPHDFMREKQHITAVAPQFLTLFAQMVSHKFNPKP